ncbi:MAG: S4 domain-containing protein [Nanoarchaeota archaeon]
MHLKRLAMPKIWPLSRKETVFVARPLPGRDLKNALPISIVLKQLGYGKTRKEIRYIITSGKVLVNCKKVNEINSPIGLFDVVSIPQIHKHYRLIIKNKKLRLHEINESESEIKIIKVIDKRILKGKRVQCNLSDGRNILGNYKVGESIVFNLKNRSVADTFKVEKGFIAFFASGKHLGSYGKIDSISGKEVKVNVDRKEVTTSLDKIIVIGKEKPVISLPK